MEQRIYQPGYQPGKCSRSTLGLLGFLLCLAFGLSGCVTLKDPESSQEFRADIVSQIKPGETAGQTVFSRRANVNGVQLWLNVDPGEAADQHLKFALYRAMGDDTPIITKYYRMENLAKASTLTIPLSTPPGSANQSYYLEVSCSAGSVILYGRAEDAYPGGQAYLQKNPVPGDWAFRLSYEYDLVAALSDSWQVIRSSWLAVPLLAMLVLPGWIILKATRFGRDWDWVEQIAVCVGLSMALIPLLMLWTTTLGLHWNRLAVLTGAAGLVILGGWQWVRRKGKSPQVVKPGNWRINLMMLGIFCFSLAVRLAMVRDLALPAWVDPVHHATLARLIVEQGAFPASYSPYIDGPTASYHPGFHSLVAVFHWLSYIEIPQAMLLLGQVLNALSVLAVYLFTTQLTNNRLAGILAAIIAGVFTPMPAYYTSWGRYTELAGLLILPTVVTLSKCLLENFTNQETAHPDRQRIVPDWGGILLTGMAGAGLFLTHYRVLVFLIVLGMAYLPRLAGQFKGLTKWEIIRLFLQWIAATIAVILLTIPWWPNAVRTLLTPNLALQHIKVKLFADFNWVYLTAASGKYASLLGCVGLVWGLIQRQYFPIGITLWIAGMFFLANLGAWGLPGASFINNTSVEISLFMPTALACGYLFSWLFTGWNRIIPLPWRRLYQVIIASGIVVASYFAARILLPILNPVTMLARQADVQALGWINDNLPVDETFLINSTAWGYQLYAGSDGGYWITPITGRKTMPPPLLYGLDITATSLRNVAEICKQAITYNEDPAALRDWLMEHSIKYIYLGVRGGTFSPDLLQESPQFKQIYAQDGVSIFEVLER